MFGAQVRVRSSLSLQAEMTIHDAAGNKIAQIGISRHRT
jgi:hypothetical protein